MISRTHGTFIKTNHVQGYKEGSKYSTEELVPWRVGEPFTARRPNSANRLFLPIKHYWNTAIPIYLHIVCGCFHATMGELVAATEIILNTKLKIFSPDQCSSLVGHHPTKWKVAGLIPGQGICLGCGPRTPSQGRVREVTDWCFSYTSTFPSFSFSLPSPLRINK